MYTKTILVLALFAVILTWSASDAKLFLDEYELDEYELELVTPTKSSSSTKSKSKGTKSNLDSTTSTTNKKIGTTTPSSTKKTTTKGKDGKTVTVSRKGPSLWVWGVFAVVVLVSAGYMYIRCSPNFKKQKITGPEVYEGSDA